MNAKAARDMRGSTHQLYDIGVVSKVSQNVSHQVEAVHSHDLALYGLVVGHLRRRKGTRSQRGISTRGSHHIEERKAMVKGEGKATDLHSTQKLREHRTIRRRLTNGGDELGNLVLLDGLEDGLRDEKRERGRPRIRGVKISRREKRTNHEVHSKLLPLPLFVPLETKQLDLVGNSES